MSDYQVENGTGSMTSQMVVPEPRQAVDTGTVSKVREEGKGKSAMSSDATTDVKEEGRELCKSEPSILDGLIDTRFKTMEECDEYQKAWNAKYLAPDRQRAINEKAWFPYLFILHNDNERPSAFRSVSHLMTDRKYWSYLGDVWNGYDGTLLSRTGSCSLK